ncbi:NACHT domain-containing protein [Streptomyces phyllanthi]|uniref:NACHT domain-containing protein n=1 Tax=Streptomyces phyllanthi TaxID=1803180 RepID=A0A5N8W5N3_9ACTN|nr:NACHT domain-containing protein [Streptomyces phyllanthi]MPY41445.1 NACHT domain-containing protein [Streptomyces phyllanthi]
MRGRWVLTWGLCGVLALSLTLLWDRRGGDFIATASSVLATVVGLFGVLSVWAWRRDPRRGRSGTEQLSEAEGALARLVERQWRTEGRLRQLFDPAPLPVVWSDSPRDGVCDHRELIGEAVSCRADRMDELAAMFRRLSRGRLVVLGEAGAGKSTFAVLLALSLLRARESGEPVPVLLTAASFDPARENVHGWLCRRIAADYPALTDVDTYGPSAVEDLLAGHRVLPVIDGLDELPPSSHAAVLAALNDTLDTHAPVVLTCRTSAYTAAVDGAGVLVGAAVVEPAPVSASDALGLLRLATPPGPRQEHWRALDGHLAEEPQGPLAQALTSPLMVALARTVYADDHGDPRDPSELRRLPTREAVEDHLLDALVPAVYARARSQDPAGRPWSPERAHRHLAHLAAGMQRQGTNDLAWWQLYRWVPVSARVWSRSQIWAVILIALTLLGYGICGALPGLLPGDWAATLWYLQGAALALPCMCWYAARVAERSAADPRRLLSAVRTAVCGGVAFALPGTVIKPPVASAGWYVFGCVCFMGFAYLLVLHSAGLPAPPSMPSHGTLGTRRWRHRLPRAAATVVVTTVLSTAALRLYSYAVVPKAPSSGPEGAFWYAPDVPWMYGLAIGLVFGTVQALLYWLRGTTSTEDRTDPVSTVQADRLVTLVSGCAGALLISVPYGILVVLDKGATSRGFQGDIALSWLQSGLLGMGWTGLVLTLAACAWPYYTVARLLSAARGRLPWRLQAFLADAHRLGILRQVGPVYQFRHARLQERMARHVRVPRPRTSVTGARVTAGR